jgi:hypothetical protein
MSAKLNKRAFDHAKALAQEGEPWERHTTHERENPRSGK